METRHKSKDLITHALYHLLFDYPYNKITIKDICNKAGVSRMSFYRYFSSKEDIFSDYCDERFVEYYNLFIKKEETVDLNYMSRCLFVFLKQYSKELQILNKAGFMYLLLNKLSSYLSYILAKMTSSELQEYRKNKLSVPFFAGGVYNIIVYWVNNNFADSEEEMDKMFNAILANA